jgi:hypothetical protein
MTAKEALWLIKVQLHKTEQNLQAIKVLSDIVSIVDNIHIDDTPTLEHLFGDTQYDIDTLTLIDDDTPYQLYGTEAQHFKNHLDNVAKRDLKKHKTDGNDDGK